MTSIRVLICVAAVMVFGVVSASTQQSKPSAAGDEPLRWRDGYVTWRHKLVKPNWQIFDAKDGTEFAVDMDHIDRKNHHVVFYSIGGDAFDPKNLIEFTFNCKDMGEVVSGVGTERVKLIEEQAEQMACGGPDQ
ncbi:exported hypothetical protein [Bradyrhizobium sp. STM 3843]|uniref:hypothetical protein n=1 Tax=Bradyrhizobium sp. STM 3843 TaxID=551947 RepID=UPI0002403D98|nr:hypothetical protein [Bradyrhizobium sp. STM 3843]CCE11560.1 exported hypothetical protein [Bradyrhizobium sp. STM 3843]